MQGNGTMIRWTALLAFVFVSIFIVSPQCFGQANSTRKIRLRPSKVAAKCGSWVKWRESVDKAIEESKKSGKPVFWYVPTVPGSFMDRKPEIDRYMLSGPFSWPTIIDVLNKHYIPVKSRPSRLSQRKYQLQPYKFVEPGFVVIDAKGKVTASRDQLTTLHTQWFLSTLYELAGQSKKCPEHFWQSKDGSETANVWMQLAKGQQPGELTDESIEKDPEAWYLKGVLAFEEGDSKKAAKVWRSLARKFPNHPLGAKAAAESEGHGPFARGFEVYRSIPKKALRAGFLSRGSAAQRAVYDKKQLWKRNVDFLLRMQRKDGSFVDSTYDFGGTDSMPNVYTAVTSLCGMALLESKSYYPEKSAEIDQAIQRARQFVMAKSSINKVDRDEILWAYAYRLRFLCQLKKSGLDVQKDIQIATTSLENVQSKRGNWYHEYNNSFVTATALVALNDAQKAGAKLDNEKIEKGLKALAFDRFESGAYPYYSRRPGNRRRSNEPVPAAAGRMAICELGLFRWGKSSEVAMEKAATASLRYHNLLAKAYKYDNHTNTYAYGGFFFWYDMRARSEAIMALGNKSLRAKLMEDHLKLVMELPELDGCFVDSHELGRCYGSAMGLLCLAMADDVLEMK